MPATSKNPPAPIRGTEASRHDAEAALEVLRTTPHMREVIARRPDWVLAMARSCMGSLERYYLGAQAAGEAERSFRATERLCLDAMALRSAPMVAFSLAWAGGAA